MTDTDPLNELLSEASKAFLAKQPAFAGTLSSQSPSSDGSSRLNFASVFADTSEKALESAKQFVKAQGSAIENPQLHLLDGSDPIPIGVDLGASDSTSLHLVKDGKIVHTIDLAQEPAADTIAKVTSGLNAEETIGLASGSLMWGENGQTNSIYEEHEHDLVPTQPPIRTHEAAQALPLATPGENLFRVINDGVQAFRDADEQVRHIFMNASSLWVKA